ncbi:MAG: phosphoglucosamine mutase [Fidelibacterota bacterium]
MLIESISGVRGIFPSDLDAEVATRYAGAFFRLCRGGKIMVGRDTRPSGSQLVSAITANLESLGASIRDCGICPTPTLQFSVGDTDAAGGIMVTASHNPPQWNGLKFVDGDGCFLNGDQFSQLVQHMNTSHEPQESGPGSYSRFDGAALRHIQRILSVRWLDVERIRQRVFSVAVDAVNGAASGVLPSLLERLGCTVTRLNCEPSGQFTRDPEPLPQHLTALSKAVREGGCDVGFAVDPDGDRLAIVDESGRPLGEEYTLVFAVDDVLTHGDVSPVVVTNLSTTQAVDDISRRYGAQVHRTAVGEIHVVEGMKQKNASVGGEGNGGVILREVHLGRDSLVAAALVLDRMARTEESVGKIFDSFPRYVTVKERIPRGDKNPEELLETLALAFPRVSRDRRDGLKLLWPERWVHVRPSNTEPIIRIYGEAKTEESALELVGEVTEILGQHV